MIRIWPPSPIKIFFLNPLFLKKLELRTYLKNLLVQSHSITNYQFVTKIFQIQNHSPALLPGQFAKKNVKKTNHVEWMIFLSYYKHGQKKQR